MSNWPEPSIVARTAERSIHHPLVPGVQDEFPEKVDKLAVGSLRGVVRHEHSAAGKDIVHPSIHLYIEVISHFSCKF
jgi:hypothetical protein